MLIELLYFAECPNYKSAQENLLAALDQLHITSNVNRIEVHSNEEAATKRFLGSPSIRIDDRDIEYPDETGLQYSMRCRLYKSIEGVSGTPPKQMIISAISKAMKNA